MPKTPMMYTSVYNGEVMRDQHLYTRASAGSDPPHNTLKQTSQTSYLPSILDVSLEDVSWLFYAKIPRDIHILSMQ